VGQAGGGSRAELFFSGELGEFVEAGKAGFDFSEGVFFEGLEDPIASGDAKVLDAGFFGNGFADMVVDGEHFEDGESAFVSNAHAFVAANGGVELLAGELFEVVLSEGADVGFEVKFAVVAKLTEKALAQDGGKG